MADLLWRCPTCGLLSGPCEHAGSSAPICADCGMVGPACTCRREPDRPPLSRDALLHEIARSLRATHPERAEEMIRDLERRVPTEWTFQTPGGAVGLVVRERGYSIDQLIDLGVRCANDDWPMPVAVPVSAQTVEVLRGSLVAYFREPAT